MKQRLLRFCCTIILLCSFCVLSHAQELVAFEGITNETKDKKQNPIKSLKHALEEIEEQYNVSIAYKSELIKSKIVDAEIKSSGSLEKDITVLINQHDLKFKKIKKNFYVIEKEEVRVLQKSGSGFEAEGLIVEDAAITVKGQVTSENGETIPGVNILVKGTATGTVTDINGNYTLNVPEEGVLVFSSISYITQEVAVNNKRVIDVTMEEDMRALEEVVVVGYGSQKKTSLTSAVSTIDGKDMQSVPVANPNNALAGRVTGAIVRQNSGEPGNDAATINIRGIGTLGNSDPLVVVDGIYRDLASLNPYEIESITVLKDAASVAPYGVRGANGVILVTTKRGAAGKLSFSYNGNVGLQTPTAMPNVLSSYEYAKLKNLANQNVGQNPSYNEEDLQKFQDGSDPDRYPNTNLFDMLLEPSLMTQHNLSMSGGTDKVKAFFLLGYLDQKSNWGDATRYKKYNLRTNVDFNVSENTNVSFDFSLRVRDATFPGVGADGVMIGFYRINPTNPVFYSDGRPAGYFEKNPYLDINESGYTTEDATIFNSTLSLDQKIPFIPGLTARATVSYDKEDGLIKQWKTPYEFYQLQPDGSFTSSIGNVTSPTLSQDYNKDYQLLMQLSLNFKQQFDKHGITGLAVFEPLQSSNLGFGTSILNYQLNMDELSTSGNTNPADKFNHGSSSEYRQVGYVYRLTYNFDERYMLETSGRYDGHYYFAPEERFAFFPSASAAWRPSEEEFMKEVNWVDELKLRVSWGKSGSLAGGPFQYMRSFSVSNNPAYLFGTTPLPALYEGIDPNPNITWEKSTKFDVGLEFQLWEGHTYGEVDVFREKRSDMLIDPSVIVPVEYGIPLGQENRGVMENRGYELRLGQRNRIGNFWNITTEFNYTYVQNKLIEVGEPEILRNNSDRSRTGKPLGTLFGFKSLGYFQSQQEIDDTPYVQNFTDIAQGDIKYWDKNEDGVLNSEDQVAIGGSRTPTTILGLNLGVDYKNLSLNMLLQGAMGTDIVLSETFAMPFRQGTAVAFESHLDYWTEDNPDAAYPRTTPSPTSYNLMSSSHWIWDASYLRLKSLVLSYSLNKLANKIGMNGARMDLSGQNLFTLTGIKNYDPEAPGTGSYYFQQKVFSLGVNLDF